MPRYHNLNGVRVQFTAAEEAAQDAISTAWNTPDTGGEAVRNAGHLRITALEAKLADNSITFDETKELMRLRGN